MDKRAIRMDLLKSLIDEMRDQEASGWLECGEKKEKPEDMIVVEIEELEKKNDKKEEE